MKIIYLLCTLLGVIYLGIGMAAAAETSTTFGVTYHQGFHHTDSIQTKSSASQSYTKTKIINVMIYNGRNSDSDCVNGIKISLIKANNKKLVPGYMFRYSTSHYINSAVLKYYNVLVMPGGDDYINDYGKTISSINPTAIRNFVARGNGYIGICAGAYSGAKYTDGWYRGWGVGKHINCKGRYHVGRLTIQINSAGRKLFGYGGVLSTIHWNGPAMYPSGGQVVTFASYADNIIGSKGMGAIVGDTYYNGRAVLLGPHLELYPQYPGIIAKLILWSDKKYF